MAEYILVKKSQVSLFKSIPFYYQTKNGEYSLYKKKGDRLDETRLKKTKYPDLYILDADRETAMAALIHDVGCSQIDKTIIETSKRLTDKQFKIYTTHPEMGHDMIIQSTDFDMAIPKVALEHHERIDGSGYPNGLTRLASYSQLIGLIDSYESLTYRGKAFRKVKKPFATLSLIKEEVMRGKFSKELFKRFTSCLGA